MERIQLPSNVVPEHYEIFVRPDAANLRFEGTVKIRIRIVEATSAIVLNAADLQISRAVLASRSEQAGISLNGETATLKFERPIELGVEELSLDYTGKIYESAQGLFISRYDTAEGSKHMLLTQFEAVAARRFLPCWDEPARKATFSLSVAVPPNETAVSNMPVDEGSELPGGFRRIRFQTTPKMSSYLLFLGMGDFEPLEATAGSTKVRVMARRGSASKGKFALESAVQLLAFYNEYFGVPYPLPKLDLIAAPGAGGFSAMENWGAILYFEPALLVDPESSPESARQRVFVVVAHEMAHQWFGNLVTMEWWDNLWLNEGFASWMENKATDSFHPEWLMWLQSETDRQRAMRQDAKRTTHPVVQPVVSGEEADQAFDDITYRKGQAVIRMIESYIGETAFRDGVRAYMKRYAYKNTVTDQLWAELESAARKSTKTVADDFTLQTGVPLVSLEAEQPQGTRTTLTVRQGRFAVDESAGEVHVWHTPVSAAPVGSSAPVVPQLVIGPGRVSISVGGAPPIKLNFGQNAYYRSRYSREALLSLAARFGSLTPADQLGLLNDSWALGEAGLAPVGDYLGLIQRVSLDAETVVWRQLIETLVSIDSVYAGLQGRNLFRAFGRDMLNPRFKPIGWNAQAGESDNIAVLREDLLYALGRFAERSVVDEARRRFEAFLVDPKSLPAGIRLPTFRVAALWSDAALYERMHDAAKRTGDALQKDQLFVSLASAQDPALAARTLELALRDEPDKTTGPAKTTGPSMISRVAVDNPDLAWQFALVHLRDLDQRLDALQRHRYVPALGAQSNNPARLAELRRFIDEHVPPKLRKQVERFYSDLEFRLKVRTQRVPEIDMWLAGRARAA